MSVRVYNQCYEVLLVLADRGLQVPQVSPGIVKGGREGGRGLVWVKHSLTQEKNRKLFSHE